MDTALQLSAVYACVKLIAETVACLPLKMYRIESNGTRMEERDHPVARLIASGKMNSWQTRQEFFETVVYQLVLLGNCYSKISKNARGDVVSLVPFMSGSMQVYLNDNSKITYKYTEDAKETEYQANNIWHTKLFGNGLIGLSTISYMAMSVGIGQGAEFVTSKIYQNNGKPSGTVTFDQILSPEQREQFRSNFKGLATGDDRLMLLEGGMQFKAVSLSPQDIELLQSRRFQIEDIARFFGVPSVLINDTQSGTTWGSGIQEIIQGFYKFSLKPYLERFQQGMKVSLLKPEERAKYEFKFDLEALLRPSQAERVKTNREAILSGQMTPNEARLHDGLPPLEGGDKLYMQKQMTPAEILEEGTENEKPSNSV